MSRRQITQCMSLLFVTIMFSSCALLPTGRSDRAASEAPTPTPIPTAIVPTKPTYKVQKGEVVDELTFSGRISPVLENELYFRTDGRVRTVFSKRNDVVKKGTVIAELENDALERDLVLRTRLLRAVWEGTASDPDALHGQMVRDLYLAAVNKLAQFCLMIEIEQD